MGPAVAGLVLLSALLHATWNTVVKSDEDHLASFALVTAVGGLVAAAVLFPPPRPGPASVPRWWSTIPTTSSVFFAPMRGRALRRPDGRPPVGAIRRSPRGRRGGRGRGAPADELLTTGPPGVLEFRAGEQRMEGRPERRERCLDTGAAVVLFAIDEGDRPEHPQPFLAALADRVDERAAARDDVLDHDHRVPRDHRTFEPAPGTVRLGGLPDREPREGSRRPGAVVADGGRQRIRTHRGPSHCDRVRRNEPVDECADERARGVIGRRERALDVVVGEPPRGEPELSARFAEIGAEDEDAEQFLPRGHARPRYGEGRRAARPRGGPRPLPRRSAGRRGSRKGTPGRAPV